MKTRKEILEPMTYHFPDADYVLVDDAHRALEEYASQFKPREVTDEEIEKELERPISTRDWLNASFNSTFREGAKWMRDKLTNKI